MKVSLAASSRDRSEIRAVEIAFENVRGAGRVSQNKLYPSAGVGVNLMRNFGGLAISFRIDKR